MTEQQVVAKKPLTRSPTSSRWWIALPATIILIALALSLPFGNPQWSKWHYVCQANFQGSETINPPKKYSGKWRSWRHSSQVREHRLLDYAPFTGSKDGVYQRPEFPPLKENYYADWVLVEDLIYRDGTYWSGRRITYDFISSNLPFDIEDQRIFTTLGAEYRGRSWWPKVSFIKNGIVHYETFVPRSTSLSDLPTTKEGLKKCFDRWALEKLIPFRGNLTKD